MINSFTHQLFLSFAVKQGKRGGFEGGLQESFIVEAYPAALPFYHHFTGGCVMHLAVL